MDPNYALELLWPPGSGAASTVKLAVAKQLAADITQPLRMSSIADTAKVQLGAPVDEFLREAPQARA